MASRRILLCLAVAAALAVFAFSILPERDKAHTTGRRFYAFELGNGNVMFVNPHRIAHWTAFGMLTAAFASLARTAA